MNSFKINDYFSLRLEGTKTIIYLKGDQQFKQCKFLLLNISKDNQIQKKIKSIDEAQTLLNSELEGITNLEELEYLEISPEEEFWAHCSNLQAWYENDYNTKILHRNLAFPLLKALT